MMTNRWLFAEILHGTTEYFSSAIFVVFSTDPNLLPIGLHKPTKTNVDLLTNIASICRSLLHKPQSSNVDIIASF